MRKLFFTSVILVSIHTLQAQTNFQPQDTEFYSPKLRTVNTLTDHVPSDAIQLFSGTDLTKWISTNDPSKPAPWIVENGILTVKPNTGGI